MSSSQFAGALRSGTTLQRRWRVGLRIAGSARTTIYSAVDGAGEHVAIEVLDAGLVADVPTRKSFVEAGFQANAVGHPAIARVIEVGSIPDGAPCLVLDLREGEGLEPYRQGAGGTLDPSEVVDLFVQLLDALAAAHERGIVHGDIRTTSLFIEVDGRLRVLDFGFAETSSSGPKSARSDVRAASATAFLLLTGSLPGSDASDVLEGFVELVPRVFVDVVALALGPTEDARTETPALRRALANLHPRSARRPRPAVAGPNEQTREMRSLDPELAAALLRDDGPAPSPEAPPPAPAPPPPSLAPVPPPPSFAPIGPPPRASAPPTQALAAPAALPSFSDFATHDLSTSDLDVPRSRPKLHRWVVGAVFVIIAAFLLASLFSR